MNRRSYELAIFDGGMNHLKLASVVRLQVIVVEGGHLVESKQQFVAQAVDECAELLEVVGFEYELRHPDVPLELSGGDDGHDIADVFDLVLVEPSFDGRIHRGDCRVHLSEVDHRQRAQPIDPIE